MLNINLSKKQAVMLAGILGVTEGVGLNEVYGNIMERLNDEEKIIADDIANLINEQALIGGIVINEDNLYMEAKMLNGSL